MLRSLFLILLSFCLFQSGAQSPNLKFKHITSKDGLVQNNVLSILQDSRGFMWFGTRDGLNRFDGYNFRLFQNDPKDTLSISNNFVRSLCEDREGYIWVGTSGGGLERLDVEKEEFTSFNYIKDSETRLPDLVVNSIVEDQQGNLWIGTGGGLARLNKSRTRFTIFKHDPKDDQSIKNDNVRALMADSDGNIWVGFWPVRGVNKYDQRTGILKSYDRDSLTRASGVSDFVRAFYESEDGYIYIGTDGGGMSRYDPENERFVNFKYSPDNPQSISHNVVSAISEDDRGNIWIGTENGGLCLFDPTEKTFVRYYQDDIDTEGINNNSIYSLYKDSEGNIWAGTYTGGVNVFFESYNTFEHYRKKRNESSLSHNNVLSFEEDHLGNIWVGTDGGGLNLFDPVNKTFKWFRQDKKDSESISSDFVVSLLQDSRLNLWAGTWRGGLNLYNPRNQSFSRFSNTVDSMMNSDRIWVTYEDHLGKFWIGTFYDGLYQYDFESGELLHFVMEDSLSISQQDITVIIEDKYNRLWVGTDQAGLNLYNRENQTFYQFTKDAEKDCGLSDNNIFCAFKDYKGDLWFGTNKGLHFLDADKLTFKKIRAFDGFGNDMILGIQEDNAHNLWISSNKGIARFNPQTGTSRFFTKAHGLQDVEFKRGASFKDSQGFLYFGGINGFNRFHPDSIRFNHAETPVKIVDLRVNSHSVKIGAGDSLLSKSITALEEIQIPIKYNVFSLHYAALSYNFSAETEYAYLLENFDTEWHYVGKSRNATYTNLYPGEYIFKVKCLIDGKWEAEQTLLNIVIPPPFWQQLWFVILMGIVVIIAFVGFFYWRVQKIHRKNQKLSALIEERTSQIAKKNAILKDQKLKLSRVNKELKQRQRQITLQTRQLMEHRSKLEQTNATKDKFFSIIGHDLRNPFHTILGFSELLLVNLKEYREEELERYIRHIHQTAEQTYNLFEDLLLWANAQSEHLTADFQNLDLYTVCAEVVQLMQNQGRRKGVEVSLSEQKQITVRADFFMLKTIIRNLLSNAIKFTGKGGQVRVMAEKREDKAIITVSDSGVGIEKEGPQKLWEALGNSSRNGTDEEKGSGLGLLLCKEFVEEQGGDIWVESEPGKGSDFIFSLPLGS
ncbi:sensor histidine kinase [Marinilabilia salmonicolor]|uniref:sensor histidine kinase n=1 Tax=Marinilabilia salmonicolor TaxID=989 RepID=UPI000299D854|nr:sensor histidine kinase [Marinilabilia salmonicolor]